MAYFYTYIDPAEIEAQFKKKEGDDGDDEDTKGKLHKLEAEVLRRDSVSSDDQDQKSKQTSFWTKATRNILIRLQHEWENV